MTTKLTFEEWKKLNLDSVKLSEEAKADSLIMNDKRNVKIGTSIFHGFGIEPELAISLAYYP